MVIKLLTRRILQRNCTFIYEVSNIIVRVELLLAIGLIYLILNHIILGQRDIGVILYEG